MEEKVIEIREDLQAEVRRLALLMAHYQQTWNSLQGDLRHLLKVGHGVDITEPGWRLDAEGGKLAHVPPTPPVAPPVAPEQEG